MGGCIGRAANAASSAAGKLAHRLRGTADDGCDFAERNGEHVVQDEREAFRGFQLVEHHEQRETDGICEQRFIFGAAARRPGRDRFRRIRRQRVFAPGFSRSQHVEAHARDDGGEPSPEIVDAGGIRSAEPQPRFLDRIVHLADRAEHPVSH